MIKARFRPLLITALLSCLLAACGGDPDDTNDAIDLTANLAAITEFDRLTEQSFPACGAPRVPPMRATFTPFGLNILPTCFEGCDPGFSGFDLFCTAECPTDEGFVDNPTGRGCLRPQALPRTVTGLPGVNTSCATGFSIFGNNCLSNCPGGYDTVGLTCVEQCNSPYSSTGPNCSRPPSGECSGSFPNITCDTGHTYLKHVTTRSTSPLGILECPAGSYAHNGLCYPECAAGYSSANSLGELDLAGPLCQKNCPDGMIEAGPACINDVPRLGRAPQNPCLASSFSTSPAPGTGDATPFTMIVFNDPQMWWGVSGGTETPQTGRNCKTICNDPAEEQPDVCKDPEESKQRCRDSANVEAESQARAMNAVAELLPPWPVSNRPVQRPVGVIINGDLTARFHDDMLQAFEKYYVRGSNAPSKFVLEYPVYFGLGNHDYENDLAPDQDGCNSAGEYYRVAWGTDGCARRGADYIKGMMSCDTIENFPRERVEKFDVDSLAYSWNIGKFHFIQLNNYPTYATDRIEIEAVDYAWLEADMQAAVQRGQKIVFNMHDYNGSFSNGLKGDGQPRDGNPPNRGLAPFVSLLQRYQHSIAAVFAGHELNPPVGYNGLVGVGGAADGIPDTSIPLFRGGHAGTDTRNTFLLVEFRDDSFTVGAVGSHGGVPRWLGSTEPSLKTVELPSNPVLSNKITVDSIAEGQIANFNYTLTALDPALVTFAPGSPSCGAAGSLIQADPKTGFSCLFPQGPASSEMSVAVQDAEGVSNTLSHTINITNVAPQLIEVTGDTIFENQTAEVTAKIVDPGIFDSFSLAVTWGEGPPETYSFDAGTTTFTVTHTYLDDGLTDGPSDTFPIVLTFADSDNGMVTATTQVVVINVEPTVTANPVTIDEGGTANLTGKITDPGTLDSFTVEIDWGDGSPVDSFSYAAGVTDIAESHLYPDDNPTGTASDVYDVQVSVTDDDSGQGSVDTTVTVNNIAPTITANSAHIDENGTATIGGSITDPGVEDPLRLVIDWGEGGPQTYHYPPGTTAWSESHVYLDDNPTATPADIYPVSLSIHDDDLGNSSLQTRVRVDNVDPQVAIDAITDETGARIGVDVPVALTRLDIDLTGHFSDVGSLDTHSATVDWGDGSIDAIDPAQGNLAVSRSFPQAGEFHIVYEVTDDDTGRASAGFVLTVADAETATRLCIADFEARLNADTLLHWLRQALDKIAKDNLNSAFVMLGKALEEISVYSASHTGEALQCSPEFLTLIGKSLFLESRDRASRELLSDRDRAKLAEADARRHGGDEDLLSGDLANAMEAYERATRKILGMIK